MPEIICEACGKRLFHENPDTLKIEETIHKKFCREKDGDTHSYMHRELGHVEPYDSEREADQEGKPILKR